MLCVLFFCVLFCILMLLIFPAHTCKYFYLLDCKMLFGFHYNWICLDTLIGELKHWTKQREVICNEQGLFLAVTVRTVSIHWWMQFDWHIAVTGWGIFLLLAHWNVRVNSSGVNCSVLWGANVPPVTPIALIPSEAACAYQIRIMATVAVTPIWEYSLS